MLSFGYTLLMYDIYTAISNQGLHPYFGFLHALKNHHPALASDLMEEWRPVLIDSMVLSLIHRHEILPEHFQRGEDGVGIFLTREGRTKFISAYEKRLRAVNKYGEEKQSYRKALETQAGKYAQALMAEDATIYHPVYIR
jgi:CRISPR-associated protein Cas1